MKTQKFIALVVLFCMIVLSCFGQSKEKVTIQSDVAPGIFILTYKAKQVENVKVSIFNSKNDLLFTESLKLASFTRPYNFNDQGQGDFKVVVEDKKEKQKRRFRTRSKKLRVLLL